jgi:hypothetical protein
MAAPRVMAIATARDVARVAKAVARPAPMDAPMDAVKDAVKDVVKVVAKDAIAVAVAVDVAANAAASVSVSMPKENQWQRAKTPSPSAWTPMGPRTRVPHAADAVDATATVVSAASARSALRMQNVRRIVVEAKLRKRMAMTAPRANRVKAVKADAAVEAGAVAMTEARV